MDNDQYLCDIPVHQQLKATSRTLWLLYSSNIQKTLKIGIINFGCQPMPILFWRSGENDFDKKLCYFKYAVIFQLSIHLLFSISCLCLTQQGRYLTILFRIQLCSYLKLFDVWSLWFFSAAKLMECHKRLTFPQFSRHPEIFRVFFCGQIFLRWNTGMFGIWKTLICSHIGDNYNLHSSFFSLFLQYCLTFWTASNQLLMTPYLHLVVPCDGVLCLLMCRFTRGVERLISWWDKLVWCNDTRISRVNTGA